LVGGQVPDWHLLAVYWMTPEMQKAHDLAVAGSQNFRASEAINRWALDCPGERCR
jgi:hypothetical protein